MIRIMEWALGIIGAITGFMGLVIMFADESQYVGIGGDLAWRVGDLGSWWGYGLLFGGIVLLAGSGALLLWERRHPRAYDQASDRAALITHAVVFVLVNAFLWFQDIVTGGGLEYAYWATIPWGIGLTAHAVAYFSAGRHTGSPRPA